MGTWDVRVDCAPNRGLVNTAVRLVMSSALVLADALMGHERGWRQRVAGLRWDGPFPPRVLFSR